MAVVIVDQIIDLSPAPIIIVIELIPVGNEFAGNNALVYRPRVDAPLIIQDGPNIVAVKDLYRIRALPLPSLIRKAYIKLISPGVSNNTIDLINTKAADNSPLLHHANNANRYLSPASFGSWVRKTMRTIFQEHIDYNTCAKTDKLLHNTVLRNLSFSGMETDEINYYRGVQPTSVASQDQNTTGCSFILPHPNA